MEPERWQKIKGVFDAAAALDGRLRERFLERACSGDDDLRREVEDLLASLENAESFMEHPAVAEAASMFEDTTTLVSRDPSGNFNDNGFVAGTVLADRYRILGLLGKGGMGEVYKAEDIKLSQTVALKFLPDRLERDLAALERFHSEVRMARQVAHPNVCRVFDIGVVDERHFLSMEYIHGDDLSSLLKRIGRLPPDKGVEIARQLCVGLSAIHSAGILHRDFKPANVIIDGKGKARITDFGIAGLETESSAERVGTPAYMAPEQIAGEGVSVRSDIYSLGLVLYEIFTGKPAFRADSLSEMIRKHRSETPTDPSQHVRDIDPLVEGLIFQCLEKDPVRRPPSALHVAMALPGGNPLQVALEAGETPSPEMVAASPKRGALKPAVAILCSIVALALLAFCMQVAMYESPLNRIPSVKPPEVLSERAAEIATRLGYTDVPVDRQYEFVYDVDYFDHLRQGKGPKLDISTGQPLIIAFIERQSPRYIDIVMQGNGDWQLAPRNAVMRSLRLDARGRLVEFSAIPSEKTDPAAGSRNPDWSTVFSAAELDPSRFREVVPQSTIAMSQDVRKAWEGSLPDHPEVDVRIEAAALQGQITFFKLIYPWTKTGSYTDDQRTTRDWIAIFIYASIAIGVLLGAIALARRNVRSGSADRKGAFKIALAVLLFSFCGVLLSMNHVPAFLPEIDRFMHAVRFALQGAATAWLVYLALEPSVRRNWPELIVSWNRLLAGDWRDPLVGRDVLIGTLIGIMHFALIYLGRVGERSIYGDDRMTLFPVNESLNGLRFAIADILSSVSSGIGTGFMFVCLLVLCFMVLRRRLYAAIAVFAIIYLVELLFFTHTWVYVPITFLIGGIVTLAIARFGLVAMVVSMAVFLICQNTLFTLNFSAWYAGGMLVSLAVIVGLLGYGFKVSVANSPIFGNGFAREIGRQPSA